MNMKDNINYLNAPIGLYRHFKGSYYFVQNVATDVNSGEKMCYYFNVLLPHLGLFVRPLKEWYDEYTNGVKITERLDNYTGQSRRFERVYSIEDNIKNISTEHLIRELGVRADSPLQELDIEGLSDRVFCSDYVVGVENLPTEDTPKGVTTLVACTTEQEAKEFLATHVMRQTTKIYKRTFIEVE